VVHCSGWITVVVSHWPGHLEVTPFAPTPEQGREPLAADYRQPKFSRIALGDVLN
jgi:hypothetical protein